MDIIKLNWKKLAATTFWMKKTGSFGFRDRLYTMEKKV